MIEKRFNFFFLGGGDSLLKIHKNKSSHSIWDFYRHVVTYIKRMSRTLLLLNSLENIKMHPVLEKFKTI